MEFTKKQGIVQLRWRRVDLRGFLFVFWRVQLQGCHAIWWHPLARLVGKILPKHLSAWASSQDAQFNLLICSSQNLFWQQRTPLHCSPVALSHHWKGPVTAPSSEASPGKGCCSPLQPGLAVGEMLFLGLCDHPSNLPEVLNAPPKGW